jgi:hypothetical protein
MFRSSEGSLGVDHPVMAEQESEPCVEVSWLSERYEVAVELELGFMERGLQTSDELAAEDATEDLDRKEEGAA